MSSYGEESVFDGTGGYTCDDLIRSVRRQSLAEGKHKDDEWMALTCASSLSGPVLRWYEGLDEETQESWKLLRAALLRNWTASTTTSLPTSGVSTPASAPVTAAATSNIPTPAAVPGPTPAHATSPAPAAAPNHSAPVIASPPPVIQRGGVRTGRICIIQDGGGDKGYVSEKTIEGCYFITQSISEALKVSFTPSVAGRPHEMMFASNSSARLALSWIETPTPAAVEQNLLQGALVFGAIMSQMPQTWSNWLSGSPATTPGAGPAQTSVWTVSIDGTITLMWAVSSGALFPVDAGILITPSTTSAPVPPAVFITNKMELLAGRMSGLGHACFKALSYFMFLYELRTKH